jgi:beta-lysine 5,6-aminomutase beta subunit
MAEMIKPYGDTLGDGRVQLAFTLPVAGGAKARKAAELYAEQLNLTDISVSYAKEIAENFTYFVIYASGIPELDYSSVQATEIAAPELDFYQINELIREKLNKKLSIVGASIGSDAHTVGIDAIMNMKGYNQDYGLERYPEINAFNLGAQVSCEELMAEAVEKNADAILVSQTITQKNAHIRNFTELVELLEAENLRHHFLLIAGGPRINNDLAIELGYDAGFGPGTLASQVAAYITSRLIAQKTGENISSDSEVSGWKMKGC